MSRPVMLITYVPSCFILMQPPTLPMYSLLSYTLCGCQYVSSVPTYLCSFLSTVSVLHWWVSFRSGQGFSHSCMRTVVPVSSQWAYDALSRHPSLAIGLLQDHYMGPAFPHSPLSNLLLSSHLSRYMQSFVDIPPFPPLSIHLSHGALPAHSSLGPICFGNLIHSLLLSAFFCLLLHAIISQLHAVQSWVGRSRVIKPPLFKLQLSVTHTVCTLSQFLWVPLHLSVFPVQSSSIRWPLHLCLWDVLITDFLVAYWSTLMEKWQWNKIWTVALSLAVTNKY